MIQVLPKMDALHPSSLRNLHLVNQWLEDDSVQVVRRGVDKEWFLNRICPKDVTGFNPYSSCIFTMSNALLPDWLENTTTCARAFNPKDLLMRELVVALHDYLHIWCYHAIATLKPDLAIGYGDITPDSLERFVFCHLLTETAAVMGLDYWYLSQIDLNDLCPLGTRVTQFATSYHQRFQAEYQGAGAEIKVNTPEFFKTLHRFYCSGEFFDLDIEALSQSPQLCHWIEHELKYGERQRRYTRAWFHTLGGISTQPDLEELADPVAFNEAWQEDLVAEIGALLWSKVVEESPIYFPRPKIQAWVANRSLTPDFRFANLNHHASTQPQLDPFFLHQWVSQLSFAAIDQPQQGVIRHLLQYPELGKDLLPFLECLGPRLPRAEQEPEALFFLG